MSQAFAIPIYRAIDASGNPLNGAKLYFYATGTTTLQSVYTTSALTTAHSNPVVADSGGLFPAIFLDPAKMYRVILKTSADVTISDQDPANNPSSANLTFDPGKAQDVSRTVESKLREVLSVEDFGAVGDGSTDDAPEIQAAIDTLEAAGGGTLEFTAGRTYFLGSTITVDGNNITLVGYGATLKANAASVATILFPFGRSGLQIFGLKFLDTSNLDSHFHIDIGGSSVLIRDVHLEKSPVQGGYQMYVRGQTSRVRMDGFKLTGSNGIYIEGTQHSFTNFDCQNTMNAVGGVGGDDLFAFKAISGVTGDIVIANGIVRGYAAIASIGSEVGVGNTSDQTGWDNDDTTYAKRVRNIVISNVVAEKCQGLVYIKPGGLSLYSYRDGVVEDITLDNLTLNDVTGNRFNRGLLITPARGCIVRRVRGRNLTVNARCYTNTGIPLIGGVDIYLPDNREYSRTFTSGSADPSPPAGGILNGDVVTGQNSGASATVHGVSLSSGSWSGGDAAGTLYLSGQTGNFGAENLLIRGVDRATIGGNSTLIDDTPAEVYDIDLQISYNDPHDGLSNSGSRPGHPVQYLARVEKENSTHGTVNRVMIELDGNGSKEVGLFVGTGMSNAVEVKRAKMRNVAVDENPVQGGIYGGIYSKSHIKIQDTEIQAPVNGYPVGASALTDTLYTAERVVLPIGTLAANPDPDPDIPIFVMPKAGYIHRAEIVNSDSITQSDTDYSTFEILVSGSAIASRNTKSTGGINVVANTKTSLGIGSNNAIIDGSAFNVAEGTVIRFKKIDSGAGQPTKNMHLYLYYVPHGR